MVGVSIVQALLAPPVGPPSSPGYTAAMVVPTGIAAAIGGYAGDAMPAARVLASVVDTLVTHPNVMNGAQMYWPQPNILYTEGYALDQWAAGQWGLMPVTARGHRIGLVLDAAIDDDMRVRHLQAANAARTTLGIDVAEYVMTDAPLGVNLALSPSGASWGTVERPDALLRARPRPREIPSGSAQTTLRMHSYMSRSRSGVQPFARDRICSGTDHQSLHVNRALQTRPQLQQNWT